LAIGAIILIQIFGGRTNSLIPLYAVGVFIPFTLSQSGMIIHWRRNRGKNWQIKSVINFIGAFISLSLVTCLFLLRFPNVWPYLIVMPILLRIFYKINHHYKRVAEQLRVVEANTEIATTHHFDGSTVIVLVSGVTRVTANAISYAQSIGDYVIAMHVSFDSNPEKEHKTSEQFKKDFPDVRFVDIHSSYRSIASQHYGSVMSLQAAADRNYSTTVWYRIRPRHRWKCAA